MTNRQASATDAAASRIARPRRAASGSVPRWLPTGRALVGGVLVATAIAGVLVAHDAAADPPSDRVLIMTRDVAAGSVVTDADLGSVPADLPPGTSAVSVDDVDDVVGRAARQELHEMDLVRAGDLFEAGRFADGPGTEVALELSPARALHGTLRAGDRVDVLSTDPDGRGTVTIATDVAVAAVADDDQAGGIGAAGTVTVRLGLPDQATAEIVTDAAVRTDVTLTLPSPADTESGVAR